MLDALNPPQRRAVEHGEGPLLILAGAGSGKTRVVTSRIAYLIAERGVEPSSILAVTFTNRAAGEMRERVGEILDRGGRREEAARAQISTFHALGARLLRWHAGMVGRDRNFTILDQDAQLATVGEVAERMGLSLEHSDRKRLRRYIERMKNRGCPPERARERTESRRDEEDADFYERYQSYLRRTNAADFGDLLLGPLEMFRSDRDLAGSYSRQWRFLMVDEFQDTNPAQYELLEHLTAAHSNLAVVGDDDQAIYRWRDATVENILGFEDDYPDCRVVKLEQNYRSTEEILSAANEVIRQNPNRREKTLWTDRGGGAPPRVYTAETGRREAEYVANEIQTSVREGADPGDFAVFYRTNAQSRVFEEQFRAAGISYRVVGGVSFYGREEIKDLLAYLQLALNPRDDVSFLRVVGTPRRGVGDRTVEKLRRATEESELDSLYGAARCASGRTERIGAGLDRIDPESADPAAAEALEVVRDIGGRPKGGLEEFVLLVADLREGLLEGRGLADLTEHLLDRIHYYEWIEDRDPERADEKRRNVVELVGAMREFEGETALEEGDAPVERQRKEADLVAESEGGRRLRSFLERSALVRDEESPEQGGFATLMTVHGAKGLEFETVFVVGMEDDLFPNVRDEEPAEIYEERRLVYVAFTRAKNRLYITNARRRRLYGETRRTRPSRFLLEVDEELLERDPRSCVDEIDYGRERRPLRGGRTRAGSWARGTSVEGDDQYFDQSAGRERGELREAVEGNSEEPGSDFSQLRDREGASGAEERENRGESKGERPGKSTAHELVGKTVTHNRFGIGEVVAVSEQGSDRLLTVDFPRAGEQTVYRKFVQIVG